jgi:hypothetical protein
MKMQEIETLIGQNLGGGSHWHPPTPNTGGHVARPLPVFYAPASMADTVCRIGVTISLLCAFYFPRNGSKRVSR